MSTITISNEQNVAIMTLNRPDKHNALNGEMWANIIDICEQLAQSKSTRALIINAAGSGSFCAGADIEELQLNISNKLAMQQNNALISQAQLAIQSLPFTTIAAIHGHCFGGGVGIALACDFRLSVAKAKFAITPSKLGLGYSIEDCRRVVNAIGINRAKEMLYLAKVIDTDTALSWGLVTHRCEPNNLLADARILAEQAASMSQVSISALKSTLGFLVGDNIDEQSVRAQFDASFDSQDFAEGANAFMEKRPANFTGKAATQLKQVKRPPNLKTGKAATQLKDSSA